MALSLLILWVSIRLNIDLSCFVLILRFMGLFRTIAIQKKWKLCISPCFYFQSTAGKDKVLPSSLKSSLHCKWSFPGRFCGRSDAKMETYEGSTSPSSYPSPNFSTSASCLNPTTYSNPNPHDLKRYQLGRYLAKLYMPSDVQGPSRSGSVGNPHWEFHRRKWNCPVQGWISNRLRLCAIGRLFSGWTLWSAYFWVSVWVWRGYWAVRNYVWYCLCVL